MEKTTAFTVVSGPDRLELFASTAMRKKVTMQLSALEGPNKGIVTFHGLMITSIGVESGDGHSWLLEGYWDHSNSRFKGYYRTHNDTLSKGRLEVF